MKDEDEKEEAAADKDLQLYITNSLWWRGDHHNDTIT